MFSTFKTLRHTQPITLSITSCRDQSFGQVKPFVEGQKYRWIENKY